MAASASAVSTNTENQKRVPKRFMSQPSTGTHVSLPPAGPSWAAVFGVSCPSAGESGPGLSSALLPKPRSPSSPCWKAPGVLLPCQAELLPRDRGCGSEPMALSRCCPGPRSRPRQQQGARRAVSSPCLHQTAWEKPSTPRAPRTPSCSARESPWTRGTARGQQGWGCPHTWPEPGSFPCCQKHCPIPGAVFVSRGIFISGIGREVGGAELSQELPA